MDCGLPERLTGFQNGWSAVNGAQDEEAGALGRTTVMIRNLPIGMERATLGDVFDEEGFSACYDFIYLPFNIESGGAFCYAFVNLTSPENAQRFRTHFTGFGRWPRPGENETDVDWSVQIQGLDNLVARYRNSPLMHDSVPQSLRPAVYQGGIRADFPIPTAAIRAPRTRRRAAAGEPS